MIKQLFRHKDGQDRDFLLSQIAKEIADIVADKLKHDFTAKSDNSPDCTDTPNRIIPQLTPREMAVLKLIVQGKSNKEIGADINLSEGGVKNIVTRLFNKLEVESRIELVVYAISNKIVNKKSYQDLKQ